MARARPKSFLIRIDGKTFDALQRWSADEFRSLNGQITWLLRDALQRRKRRQQEPRR
ncbi:MAG: hypothetical protein V1778_01270 [bacterium]